MKSMRTLMFAGIAAAGLALAGCGSDGGPSQSELDAAVEAEKERTAAAEEERDELQEQIAALRETLGIDENADPEATITELQADLKELQDEQTARMEAAAEEERKQMAAEMAATAMKLHDGLEHGLGDTTNVRTAVYANSNAGPDISVTIGSADAVSLSEDDDAMVAANHGWEGQRFTAEPEGDAGTYEAVVYSNVGEPMEGAKFNDTDNGGYALDATTGETTSVTGLSGHVTGRVDSPSFDQSAGTKEFELGENMVRVILAGSYRGVDGTYYCTPTDASTNCSAAVAAMGFTLAGGTWTFKPGNPEARFMDVPDTSYASYGWWIHKSEDGNMFTASAFAVNRGTVAAAETISTLQGKATYMGGAAGKYALHSTTGGTNDAGHFTAKATLEADFGDDMITGTIDNFMGADGEARDWSVELMEQGIGDTGTILGDDGTGTAKMTKWTIDGEAAEAAGQWSGNLYDNGDDDVPQVATGEFYSEFGRDGRMVGAFGANKQ